MPVVLEQLADIGQLPGTGTSTQRQMHHDHQQRILSLPQAQHDSATTGRAR